MEKNLPYNFQIVESTPSYWEKVIFESNSNFQKTMLLPPPNITGKLHLGHVLNSTLQDFIVRFSCLKKENVRWIAGIDHAGIATQNQVEKLNLVRPENTSQEKVDFVLRCWYPEVRENFFQQWKQLGLLIDCQRTLFTFDSVVQTQVRRAFVKLYQDQLIYRGTRVVNWDPILQSVISDIEVDHLFSKTILYYLKYPLSHDNSLYLLVATTRPETVFADTAIFVHPKDERYYRYQGMFVKHPVNGKDIPILTDESVEISFGTGVLKCTPGNDFQDYVLAQKHNLEITSCCDEKGILNESAGKWKGRAIGDIRHEFVLELTKLGICLRSEEYETNLAYSSRSNALIQPILSQQWFLDLPKLIKKIEKQNPQFLNQTKFLPSKYHSYLLKLKTDTREWCISRQLWWGHRIPAWRHRVTNEIYVGEQLCVCRSSCDCCTEWVTEKDVLDTWFSSSLWPLIVLDEKNDLFPSQKTYPLTTLVTGRDIILFWVWKMLLMGIYFTGKSPFEWVLLHGLVLDEKGKKMSKSWGNVVDPATLINKYGCDSLRLFLCTNSTWGTDITFSEKKIVGSWRVCQKLWSIANLIKNKTNYKRKIRFKDVYRKIE